MTGREIDLFEAVVKEATTYVEFGAGGSTTIAAKLARDDVITVDSSIVWLDQVRKVCASAGEGDKLTLIHTYIGELGDWGMPKDRSLSTIFPLYHTAVWLARKAARADVVMVDGRFRVACCLQSFLHCRSDTVVMVHDYTPKRNYHVVERFGRRVLTVDELAIFVRRSDFDARDAEAALDVYKADPN